MGFLLLADTEKHKFPQIYFMDNENKDTDVTKFKVS